MYLNILPLEMEWRSSVFKMSFRTDVLSLTESSNSRTDDSCPS